MATARARAILRSNARRVRASEKRTENFVLRLERFLDRNLESIIADADGYTAKEALKALADLEGVMNEAGLQEQLGRLKEIYREEYAEASELFERTTGKKALLGGTAKEVLAALEDDRLALAGKMVESYLGDVRSYVLDSVMAGTRPTMTELKDAYGDTVARQLQTEIDTSVAAYHRLTNRLKAEKAGIDKFLYAGPDDKVTRPFCAERVGQVFTQDEIDSWDNGTDLPANVYLGGWNCRHRLLAVVDEADFADPAEEKAA